ncbi:hypothetical protein AB0L01_40400, partial [Streptomyces sp. NPDC053720]
GGDRSQSVTALRRYLPELLDDGYRITVPRRRPTRHPPSLSGELIPGGAGEPVRFEETAKRPQRRQPPLPRTPCSGAKPQGLSSFAYG